MKMHDRDLAGFTVPGTCTLTSFRPAVLTGMDVLGAVPGSNLIKSTAAATAPSRNAEIIHAPTPPVQYM